MAECGPYPFGHAGAERFGRAELDEVLGQLLHEERVAIGRVHHGVDQPRERPGARHQLDEAADVVVAEPAEFDALHRPGAAQLGQRRRGRRGQVGRADGAQQHEVVELGRAGEEGQQAERRGIGPLEVVEHEQERPERREERGHRLEEQAALDACVGLAGHHGAVGGQRQLGHQSHELALADECGVASAAHHCADGLHERLERSKALRGAPAPEHGHTVVVDRRRQLPGQARLADARLADDEQHPGPPTPGRPEAGQLVGPAHEGVAPVDGEAGPEVGRLERGQGGGRSSRMGHRSRRWSVRFRWRGSGHECGSCRGVEVERIDEERHRREPGARRRPASRAATPAALMPARSASPSCVRAACRRWPRSSVANVSGTVAA